MAYTIDYSWLLDNWVIGKNSNKAAPGTKILTGKAETHGDLPGWRKLSPPGL
jgi:hypothetical protein